MAAKATGSLPGDQRLVARPRDRRGGCLGRCRWIGPPSRRPPERPVQSPVQTHATIGVRCAFKRRGRTHEGRERVGLGFESPSVSSRPPPTRISTCTYACRSFCVGGALWGRRPPRRERGRRLHSPLWLHQWVAACWMSAATAAGWDTSTAWLTATSATLAPARLAIVRCAGGNHPVIGCHEIEARLRAPRRIRNWPASAPSPHGTCESAMNAASELAGRRQKAPRTSQSTRGSHPRRKDRRDRGARRGIGDERVHRLTLVRAKAAM